LAVAAFEEVLRLIESELLLLPAEKIRERAEALVMRGEAFAGVGRKEEAKAAWNVAAQRYEELGDKKAAAAVTARLATPVDPSAESALDGHDTPVAPPPPDATPPEASSPAEEPQDTNRAANGTGA
jgi:hypothetical protein